MRKYRRFVGNLKESSDRGGRLGVRNTSAAEFFAPLPAASIGVSRDVVCAFKKVPSPSCHAMTGLSR
jgi:hypothetical protein